MTEFEAKTLQPQGPQQIDPRDCRHPQLELGVNEGGDHTGHYHCIECGKPVVKKS